MLTLGLITLTSAALEALEINENLILAEWYGSKNPPCAHRHRLSLHYTFQKDPTSVEMTTGFDNEISPHGSNGNGSLNPCTSSSIIIILTSDHAVTTETLKTVSMNKYYPLPSVQLGSLLPGTPS